MEELQRRGGMEAQSFNSQVMTTYGSTAANGAAEPAPALHVERAADPNEGCVMCPSCHFTMRRVPRNPHCSLMYGGVPERLRNLCGCRWGTNGYSAYVFNEKNCKIMNFA